MTRVLITGVRGKTGAPLVELLVARSDVEVLGGSSDPSRVALPGVQPVAFSWTDPSGWAAATDGVDALYVVRPDVEQAPELIEGLLAVAPRATRVSLLSEQGADLFLPDSWAVRTEGAVTSSGHEWTMLRPSWFMQVFTDSRYYRDVLTSEALLPFPAGGATVAWIDTRDIAAVALHTLLDDGHAGARYELSGPEALSLPRTAELLSSAVGRPVTHQDVTIEDAVADLSGFERAAFVETFERLHDGVFAVVTEAVEQLTGRPARSLATFLTDTGPLTDTAPAGTRGS